MKLKYQLNYERQFADLACSLGMHCERIAGSGMRENSVCDCVLIRNGKTYLVELKATKETVFYVTRRTREQLERLINTAVKHGVTPLLIIKFKRRGWNFITLTKDYPTKIEHRPENNWNNITEAAA